MRIRAEHLGTPLAIVAGLWLLVAFGLAWRATGEPDDSLDDLEARFQLALEALRKEYELPGMSAAFVLADGRHRSFATGWADVERNVPMSADSRMLAASIGKTFVAALTIMLAGNDTLDLDAPIARWLGERDWFERLPNQDGLTLQRLLTHTSGLPDHVFQPDFARALSGRWHEPGNPFPPEALVAFVLDAEPLFAPGEGWAYTDTGYILIGLVLEAATGKDYYELLEQRLLRPLELECTVPSDQRAIPGLAAGYISPDNPFGFPTRTTNESGHLFWNPALEWTGGGLASCPEDLARWGHALFGGEVLSPRELATMLQTTPMDAESPGRQYGAGVAVDKTDPRIPVYGHGGWIPGYTSSLRHYPGYGLTIAFQINSDRDVGKAVPEIESCLMHTIIGSASANACTP
ncbi:MAG: serine hydrolase domain-containing protein [Wenzhouxiangella sp.]|nr:serine hydrolase domain-containing protein [Wenzhouxiangella sp.]